MKQQSEEHCYIAIIFFSFLFKWMSPSSSLCWSSRFFCFLSCCLCLGAFHHGFDECVFLCVFRHKMRNEEHSYVTIIIFSIQVNVVFSRTCVVFVTFFLMSMCFCFFIIFLGYVLMWTMCACLCVQDKTTRRKIKFASSSSFVIQAIFFLCFLVVCLLCIHLSLLSNFMAIFVTFSWFVFGV